MKYCDQYLICEISYHFKLVLESLRYKRTLLFLKYNVSSKKKKSNLVNNMISIFKCLVGKMLLHLVRKTQQPVLDNQTI